MSYTKVRATLVTLGSLAGLLALSRRRGAELRETRRGPHAATAAASCSSSSARTHACQGEAPVKGAATEGSTLLEPDPVDFADLSGGPRDPAPRPFAGAISC